MENLLCDEELLASPTNCRGYGDSAVWSEDCETALSVYFEQEIRFMPRCGYFELLRSEGLVLARFKAVQWLIKSRSRLNLSFGTLFSAANYLDRFISMNLCRGSKWHYWLVELLSIACLSIASKFCDTSVLSLHEIQMEDLQHSFEWSTIQRMEMALLQALEWHIVSTTTYSYLELLTCDLNSLKSNHRQEVVSRVTDQLLGSLSDYELVEFRPSVIAASALRCSLQELHLLSFDISRYIPHNQQDDFIKCHKIMESRTIRPNLCDFSGRSSYYYPPSPVTVLIMERVEIYDCNVDLSLFTPLAFNIKPKSKKRKREENKDDSYGGN